jgi:hypothetical protein
MSTWRAALWCWTERRVHDLSVLVAADLPAFCLITGSGFKDQPSVDRMVPAAECPLVDVAELDRLWSA